MENAGEPGYLAFVASCSDVRRRRNSGNLARARESQAPDVCRAGTSLVGSSRCRVCAIGSEFPRLSAARFRPGTLAYSISFRHWRRPGAHGSDRVGLARIWTFYASSHFIPQSCGRNCFLWNLSAIQKGGFHRWIWERHRTAILQILRIAPSVKPGTVIVLANVPKDNDPFGHTMWLDLAIRLSYPRVPVDGVYFYADAQL